MRPWLVCHMMQSLDGRIDCDMVEKISGNEYYYALEELDCPSLIEGKRSYQKHLCGDTGFKADKPAPMGKEAYFIASNEAGYKISLDNPGELLWDKADNAARLCIVSEQASRQYLDYLRSRGISYIATGRQVINLGRALEILAAKFKLKRIAVVGGGRINGAFLEAGLIDELSVMIAPGIDGRIGQPALFDNLPADAPPLPLKFKSVKTMANNVLWARYLVENHSHYQKSPTVPAILPDRDEAAV
ncbi:MAG: hypothetical protein HDQ91_01715 [Desulfovibrio sp.]|nr:hypothetical protein [Desulfovibrio sp.]